MTLIIAVVVAFVFGVIAGAFGMVDYMSRHDRGARQ